MINMTNYNDHINPIIKKFCQCLNKKDFSSITSSELEDIKLFILFTIAIFTDEETVSDINEIPEYRDSYINSASKTLKIDDNKKVFDYFVLRDNPRGFNMQTKDHPTTNEGDHNRTIFIKMRELFAHGSGSINYDDDEGLLTFIYKSRPTSPIELTIVASKDRLISILEKSLANHENSSNQLVHMLFAAYKAIKVDITQFKETQESLDKDATQSKEVEKNLSKDGAEKGIDFAILEVLISLSLMLSYNKESVLDKYLEKQQCYFDCSKFQVKITNPVKDLDTLKRSFFQKYRFLYLNNQEAQILTNSFSRLVNGSQISNGNQDSNELYFCMSNKMAKTDNNLYYPTPALITHLRNSVSHGHLNINGDTVKFWDQVNNRNPYINISIKLEDLKAFLNNDIFNESLYTKTPNFEQRKGQLYLFERAYAEKDFSNLVQIYQYRYSLPTKESAISYMLESDTLSSYILEYPDKIGDVLNYQLENNETVRSYLERKYNLNLNHYHNYSPKRIEWKQKYLATLTLYKKAYESKGTNLKFWIAYFYYLYNRNRDKDSFVPDYLLGTDNNTTSVPFEEEYSTKYRVTVLAKELFELFGKDRKSYKHNLTNQTMMMQAMTTLYRNDNKVDMLFNIITTIQEEHLKDTIQQDKPRVLDVMNVIDNSNEISFNNDSLSKSKAKLSTYIDRLVDKGKKIVSQKVANLSSDNLSENYSSLLSSNYGCNIVNAILDRLRNILEDNEKVEKIKPRNFEDEILLSHHVR